MLDIRKLIAEFIGTAVLVFVAVGTATLCFGFKLFGTSYAAGVVTTALAFGLVLMALVYAIGPISGCHINPAVSLGFVVAGRMPLTEAIAYWIAQIAGGIAGAYSLLAVFNGSPLYSKHIQGLGADGYGAASKIRLGEGGAFAVEAILTFIFVMVILFATSKVAREALAGLAIGVTLVVVHLIGIPLTGTSVNPARSIGPALVVGGTALSQLWLFIVAPLVGGFIAAMVYGLMTRNSTMDVPADAVPPDDGVTA
jgi:aquaporin Z